MVKKTFEEKSFYKVGEIYSITLNPSNDYQFFNRIDRLGLVKELYTKQLKIGQLVHHNIQYKLYVEISEPRGSCKCKYDGPRVHFHGTVTFKTKNDLTYFLLFQFRRICKLGTLDIDTIKDKKHWLKYCTKQHILNIHPITII